MAVAIPLTPVAQPVARDADAGALLACAASLPAPALLDGGGGGLWSVLAVGGEDVVAWRPGDSPDPFDEARRHLGRYTVPPGELPFTGGLVGWFGYDCRGSLETLPHRHPRAAGPAVLLRAYRVFAIRDESVGGVRVVHLEDPADPERTAAARLLAARLLRCLEEEAPPALRPEVLSVARPPRRRHVAAIARAQRHIADGDVYQVNLAQRLTARRPRDLVSLYRKLRAHNPPSFGAFMAHPETALLSVSPERFLRVRGDLVETRPIKGTAPRHDDEVRDAALRKGLVRSEKDRAELAMIVDILRNDLSRVCVPGSVEVRRPLTVETHPTVHHLVADVVGRLESGRDRIDLLRACLPGGSITGAPRIRAMEIIDELEPCARGLYTGSFGYLSYDGSMDTNILIRSVTVAGEELHVFGGGGIVADSDPELEYDETLHKLRGILRALGGAEEREAAQPAGRTDV